MGMSAISRSSSPASVGVLAAPTFAAPWAAELAVSSGPPEFAMLMLFGLLLVVTLTGKNPVKGLISMMLGLLVATVGVDIFTGAERYTFGSIDLLDGVMSSWSAIRN